MQLYDYQEQALNEIITCYKKHYKSPLLIAPCGYGKTVVFSAITKRAKEKGNSVIICVHRQELLRQVCDTLERFNVTYGVISASHPSVIASLRGNRGQGVVEKIQVATIQTLAKRLPDIKPQLIIIDEAHHAVSNTFLKVIKHYNCQLLGVTATPWRYNGEGLDKVFDCMVIGAYAKDLIKKGKLSKPVYYAPPEKVKFEDVKTMMGDFEHKEVENRIDKPHITGDVISHYNKICPGAKTVVFCVSVKHAENVARQFNENGIPSASIDGKMSTSQRITIIDKLKTDEIKVLTSCELISEGFDLPSIETAIMLRPTQSLVIWYQQCGRVLRVSEGKQQAIIIDHVGNIFRHGAIENITDWTLEGVKSRLRNKELNITIKRCKNCFIIMTGNKCQYCGNEPEISQKELKIKQGELQKVELENLKKQTRKEQGNARTLEQLLQIAKERGFRKGWAYNVYNSRVKKIGVF